MKRSERAAERRPVTTEEEEEERMIRGGGRWQYRRVLAWSAVAACASAAAACVVLSGAVDTHVVAASLLSTVSPIGGHVYRLGVSQLKELVAIKEPPRALMLARAWNVDAEIQGDCTCERPYDKVTRVLAKTITCSCPYYFVPSEPAFPGEPEPLKSVKYSDGCECKRDGEAAITKTTTCTCPLDQTDEPDYDTYTDKYDPAKADAETAKKAAEQAKKNAAVSATKAGQEKPPKTKTT